MTIISTNLAEIKYISWRGKLVATGIYKNQVYEPIMLDQDDVVKDCVVDRKYHGGAFKACYVFGANHYPFFESLYPQLSWQWGMMGENLTVDVMEEKELLIGSQYQVGDAVVKISEPRQPCYKLGVKFNNQNVLKVFNEYAHPGTYLSILKPGLVQAGDSFTLISSPKHHFTVADYFWLVNQRQPSRLLLQKALDCDYLRPEKRLAFEKQLQKNP